MSSKETCLASRPLVDLCVRMCEFKFCFSVKDLLHPEWGQMNGFSPVYNSNKILTSFRSLDNKNWHLKIFDVVRLINWAVREINGLPSVLNLRDSADGSWDDQLSSISCCIRHIYKRRASCPNAKASAAVNCPLYWTLSCTSCIWRAAHQCGLWCASSSCLSPETPSDTSQKGR